MFSIYLPHVFTHFDEDFIRFILQYKHVIGIIYRVDIVPKNKNYNNVFVYFQSINSHLSHVSRFIKRIISQEKVTLTYKNSNYWIILQNTSSNNKSQKKRINIQNNLNHYSCFNEFYMKNNKFFSDLVNNKKIIKNKHIDFVKNIDNFCPNIAFI